MTFKNLFKNTTKEPSFLREVELLLRSPREYLYSYTYPKTETITILPYDAQVTRIGEEFKEEINRRLPDLQVYFAGSAALRIAGRRDIDLFAAGSGKQFHYYANELKKILGKPEKVRRHFIEWQVRRNGCVIEFLLSDPRRKQFQEPLSAYALLKKNKRLREEYERMKLASNGLSLREYTKRRMSFFNKIDTLVSQRTNHRKNDVL